MVKSYYRGHKIEHNGKKWIYSDTKEPTANNERVCGCGKNRTKEGHDGCVGLLPGVMNACCGHGNPNEAYIQFSPTRTIRGVEATLEIIRFNRKG